MRQRFVRIESRNAGVVVTVSDRAFSVLVPMLMSFAQDGISPQRIIVPINSFARTLLLRLWEADARGAREVGALEVGAFATALFWAYSSGNIRRLGLTMCTKRALQISAIGSAIALISLAACRKTATWSDNSRHRSGFVTANGVRLNYLDWRGSGPALILIHGIGDNPHIFDDLAPAFTDRFHVISYARRGHGLSEAKEPYDTATLTEDLRGLMDGLGITKAHIAGWSMGGNEITAMAGTYPQRVDRIVYLDGAYDFADPVFLAAFKMAPPTQPPASARASLDAWLVYQRNVFFPGVTDASRLDAYNRELVVIQPDGTVRDRMGESTAQALFKSLLTNRRDYTKVRCPALAFFAETMPDVGKGDSPMTVSVLAWDKKYMAPFRAASIERVKRELPGVEIVNVPGAHVDFVLTNREQVVSAMRRFLSGSPPRG